MYNNCQISKLGLVNRWSKLLLDISKLCILGEATVIGGWEWAEKIMMAPYVEISHQTVGYRDSWNNELESLG